MNQPVTNEECVRIGMRTMYYMMQGHREGQAVFNAVRDIRPDIAQQVRGSSNLNNPFYHDQRLPVFWAFLFSYGAASHDICTCGYIYSACQCQGNGSVNTESHS